MIDEQTRRKLREMNMGEMVEALDLQEADRTCMGMPFDERVRMMVDHAHEAKRASSVRRLTQRARLRFPDAEPGEMIYDGRGIDGVLIREALTCQFMDRAANVIVEGCTGTGKSFLACCIAKQACRMRRSALLMFTKKWSEGCSYSSVNPSGCSYSSVNPSTRNRPHDV